jgi:MFS family permease
MFASLAVYNYRLWFISAFSAGTGTWILRITQDWMALTVLSDNSALTVGLVTSLQFAPILLLSPLTGLVADRLPQRATLMVIQSCSIALSVTLGVITLSGHIQLWQVLVAASVVGVLSAFEAPVRQTYISEIVPATLASNAVGLNSVSFNFARMAGPAAAGFALAVVGNGWSYILAASGFVISEICLIAMRRSGITRVPRNQRSRGGLFSGFAYVGRRPDVLMIIVIVGLVGMIAMNFQLMSVLMARVEFGQGPAEFGILGTFIAVGSLCGSLLSSARAVPTMLILSLGGLGFGAACLAAAFAPGFWVFAIMSTFIGFCAMTLLVTANTAVQLATEKSMKGRVMAVYLAIFQGTTPVGAILLGWLGDELGARSTLVVAGGIAMLACLGALAVLRFTRVGEALRLNIERHHFGVRDAQNPVESAAV